MAVVLTVEPGTVLLIDEPERHLHRSIIEPFLSALLECRDDCAFVVSTHEIALPVANPNARVLMIRSCAWEENRPEAWDVELLEPNDGLPDELKFAILEARKRILFVEGVKGSLDFSLYSILFPGFSVIPRESCRGVREAVSGLRGAPDLHHVEAFGLIDGDGRTDEEVEKLARDNVFSLKAFSVEALYYCSDSIKAVAASQAKSLDRRDDELILSAKQAAFDSIQQDNNIAERMVARKCKRRVRNEMLSKLPDWKQIQDNPDFKIPAGGNSHYADELSCFNELVSEEKLDDLIAGYPLRESPVFGAIARALECSGKGEYERMSGGFFPWSEEIKIWPGRSESASAPLPTNLKLIPYESETKLGVLGQLITRVCNNSWECSICWVHFCFFGCGCSGWNPREWLLPVFLGFMTGLILGGFVNLS